MSRIGKMPIALPAKVELQVSKSNLVTVKGPKGTLTQHLAPCLQQMSDTNRVKHDDVFGQSGE